MPTSFDIASLPFSATVETVTVVLSFADKTVAPTVAESSLDPSAAAAAFSTAASAVSCGFFI